MFERFRKPLPNRLRILLLLFFPIMTLIGAMIYGMSESVEGLLQILFSVALLTQDYIEVGGVGGALLNAGLIALINIGILFTLNISFNGLLMAAFFTVFGFSFMGMNALNILPIYLGGFVYSRIRHIPFRQVVLISIFASGLAPIVSHGYFGFVDNHMAGLLIAIVSGIIIGYFIIPLSQHMLRFHDGFNLYNIGFTSGLVAIVYTSFLRANKLDFSFDSFIYKEQNSIIIAMVLVSSLYMLAIGIVSAHDLKGRMKEINARSGRLVSDFTNAMGLGTACFNMGILGLYSMLVVILMGGYFNGPVLAGVYSIIGFGAFGKHVKNITPLMVGAVLAAYVLKLDISSTSVVVPVLFVTTIAPIAGVYGWFWGLVAGFAHIFLVSQFVGFHQGMSLYNNGFTGGIIAGMLVPMIESVRRKKDE